MASMTTTPTRLYTPKGDVWFPNNYETPPSADTSNVVRSNKEVKFLPPQFNCCMYSHNLFAQNFSPLKKKWKNLASGWASTPSAVPLNGNELDATFNLIETPVSVVLKLDRLANKLIKTVTNYNFLCI